MSNTILLKRSSVANAIPSTANVAIGELAINTRDGKLYTKIRPDGVSDEIFELTQNQLITLSGDATGNGTSTIPVLLNAAQANITSVGSLTSLTVVGNITGSNVVLSNDLAANNISVTSNIVAAGNVTGEFLIANNAIVGNVTFTDISTGNITATGFANIAGNVSGSNLITVGTVTATGNVAGDFFIGNGRFLSGIDTTLISNGTSEVRVFDSGNVAFTIGAVANVVVVTPDGISVVGNVDSGNVNTGFVSVTGDIEASGNITTGNGSGGNITGANVVSANTFTASANISAAGLTVTGNITGGNIATVGQVAAGAITSSATIVATGNITGGNLITAGVTSTATLNVTGNANVGNLGTAGLIAATGNITGGNIVTVGETATGTLRSTGDALINGNLIVQGNLKYINVDDLRVQDPVIIMGTGPNGAPLTENDGLDRGIYLEYYTTETANAFVGLQNSTGNMIIANNVEFASNDIVQINSFGTLQAGNAYLESAEVVGNIVGGNISTSGTLSTTGNLSANNLSATNSIVAGTTIVATGNVTGGNINTGAQVVATGNITGGNIISIANASVAGNITVGGILTDGYFYANGTPLDFQQPAGANTEIQFNLNNDFGASNKFTFNSATDVLTVVGNIEAANMLSTTVAATGNITGGNVNTGGKVAATGTITGGNLITTGAGNVATLTVSTLANITANTAASSNSTGALTVTGGAGIGGDLYASDVYSNGDLVLTVESTVDGGSY